MAKRQRRGAAKGKRGKPIATYRIFLSHSHEDRWLCRVLKSIIEEESALSVWLDAYDVPGGGNIKERIKEGMRSCDECLILLSPTSRQSDWVKHEAGMADALDLWITLLRLHVGEDDVPKPLRDLHHLSINEVETYLKQVTGRARKKNEDRT